MSPSKKPAGPKSPRKSHAPHRHVPKAAVSGPPRRERPLVQHVLALHAAGWHITEVHPSGTFDSGPLWRVKITRFDLEASISVWEAELESALAELVRYAAADAHERR